MTTAATSLDELFRAGVADVRRRTKPLALARRAVRFVRTIVVWAVATLATALLVGLTVPNLFGYHNFIVMSGSMEPAIHTGDVVIDHRISPLEARVGDVITFRDPQDPSKLITHRVRKIEVRGGIAHFETKGDATNSVQEWDIPADGTVGRTELHLWRLGYALFWVSTGWGRMALVVLPALALGLFELLRIWRPNRKEASRDPAT